MLFFMFLSCIPIMLIVFQVKSLALPLPRLLVPTPFTKGGGGGGGFGRTPSYLKSRCPYEREICMVLETHLKVLEMLKLFT